MKSLILSQTGIYYLQQLANVVKQKVGVRHKLSNANDVINLLRYSSTSIDELVYQSYGEFISQLNDDQRTYLQSRGILLPTMLPVQLGNPSNSAQYL